MNSKIHLKQHDKLQLELKAEYPTDKNSSHNDYSVDIYFFLPRNLAVNEISYTSKEFYNDFSEYIRFKTPSISLAGMAEENNTIWLRLDNSIAGLPEKREQCLRTIKLFCSILRSAIRDDSKKIFTHSGSYSPEILYDWLSNAGRTIELFHRRRPQLLPYPETLEMFDIAEEYASILFYDRICKVYRHLSVMQNLPAELMKELAARAKAENDKRVAAGAPSVPSCDSDNSLVLYRESVLKKTMASILFLNMETHRDGVMLETLFMGIAAAVAMIFVTAIAFIWQGLYLQEFSFSFFVVWVTAYMFKDRIKYFLQNYFTSHRSRYSYDYRQKILDAVGRPMGILREGFRYMDPEKIPSEIKKVRKRTCLNRKETGSLTETVLLYRKKIELKGAVCSRVLNNFPINGIVNICRFNVRHWLNKMDNPVRSIYTSDGETLRPVPAHRDYHINIVIKISSRNTPEEYRRYRMILCRNGIRRLEKMPSEN